MEDNLLDRINRELGGTFDRAQFAHRAHWDGDAGRVEMHIDSLEDQTVQVSGRSFPLRRGESICTEHSHKYDLFQIGTLAGQAGFVVGEVVEVAPGNPRVELS